MKKKLLLPIALSCVGIMCALVMEAAPAYLAARPSNAKWVHYAKVDPTDHQPGVREYWVQCGGSYSFERPEDATYIEEGTSYDTSGFAANDPRWIYSLTNQTAIYSLSDHIYYFDEASALSGYSASSYASNAGETIEVEFSKANAPTYVANCLTVSKVIKTNADLEALQNSIDNAGETGLGGYYALLNNLSSPTTAVSTRTGTFRGTFDGRGHTIDKPGFWNQRLFGIIDGATIKDVNFTNISIFSVLGTTIKDATLRNIRLETASTISKYSNVGLVCDTLRGSTTFDNVYIDYRDHYLEDMTPVAGWNYLDDSSSSLAGLTVKCLASQPMFRVATTGGLRPSVINYVSSQYFIENSQAKYTIKYMQNNAGARTAATLLQSKIKAVTGVNVSMTTSSSAEQAANTNSVIYVGLPAASIPAEIATPTEPGGYVLDTKNKAIYLLGTDNDGYYTGALSLLKHLIGYEAIGPECTTSNIERPGYVDMTYVKENFVPSFTYRKCDWNNAYSVSMAKPEEMGYNAGFAGDNSFGGYYVAVPPAGTADQVGPYFSTNSTFHTSTFLIYPGTYVSAHPDWFATKADGTNIDTSNYYLNWQLCYTAHGNNSEYQAMVDLMASKIKSVIGTGRTSPSVIMGVADNTNVCNCPACTAASSTYGSINGTVLKFANDVAAKVNQTVTADILIFAYYGYKDAPLKNGEPTIRCNDHVKVLVAPIEANYTYPLTHSTNAASAKLFTDWAKVGKLHSWLYETNFANYLYPFNSFKATTESYGFLRQNGVEFAYSQGQHNVTAPRTGFTMLKEYLGGKFMLNTSSNYEECVSSFFASYYGSQGASMRTFFNEMVTSLAKAETDKRSALYSNPSRSYSIYQNINKASCWSYSSLTKWENLCQAAMDAETDPIAKKHIKVESIFPRFALCDLFSLYFSSSAMRTKRLALKADCEELGISLTSENGTTLSSYYSKWGIA